MATVVEDSTTNSLFEQLMNTEGKAEIIDGQIVPLPFHDGPTSLAKSQIQMSLHHHVKELGRGRVGGSTLGFVVDLPRRKSFCADVSYFDLPPAGMGFPRGAPLFAVEFRTDLARTEREIAQKSADYFAAGTLVVWDVDLLSEDVVRVFRATEPHLPTIYRRGQIAEAEPAVPAWSMPINDLFA